MELECVVEGEIVDGTSLPELASAANRYHAEAESSARSAVEAAWRAGQALTVAKAQCRHGEWLPWLNEHCPEIAPRTMQTYISIAEHYSNTSGQTYLPASITEARKAISAKKREEKLMSKPSVPASKPKRQRKSVAPKDDDLVIEDITEYASTLLAAFKQTFAPNRLKQLAVADRREFLKQMKATVAELEKLD